MNKDEENQEVKDLTQNQSNNPADDTAAQKAGTEEQNDNFSKPESDRSINVEELKKQKEDSDKQNEELKKTLEKAEHTIVKLKKEKPDLNKVEDELISKVEEKISPKLEDVANIENYKKEIGELKSKIFSLESASGTGAGESIKEPKESKPQPTEQDKRVAQMYFDGDVDRYMKRKVRDQSYNY